MPEVREHVVDGIQEYDNPLPRWWLYGFYFTIAIALVYSVIYPSLWFWGGTSHWTSAGQFDQQMAAAPIAAPKTAQIDPAKVVADSRDKAVVAEGRAIYATNCAVCHGDRAEGKIGPCLTDSKWLYGNTAEDIVVTIRDGRPRGMPTWRKTMSPDKIEKVSAYVYSLRYKGQANVPARAAAR